MQCQARAILLDDYFLSSKRPYMHAVLLTHGQGGVLNEGRDSGARGGDIWMMG